MGQTWDRLAGETRGRGARARRFVARSGGAAIAITVALGASPGGPAWAANDAELLGLDAKTLVREPQVLPSALGSEALDGLRFGDPTEGIDLVAPPQADNSGDASLELPMSVPPGRGGVQPDLTLRYDSSSENGWLGLGWDLDVGAIEVDTRWGVPRYDPDKETETYLLAGDQLGPTAVREPFLDRPEGDGEAQFVRRVDTRQELIIRHGTSPKNYWWEVRDKLGAIRWYGGYPDAGGPDGDQREDRPNGLNENAVLRDDDGNIVRWALSAARDVGVNQISYEYERVAGQRVGDPAQERGKQLYLRRIYYTEAAQASAHATDPAYRVDFLRDGDVDLDGEAIREREDVIVDATSGALEVTSDLLRRIEIRTGESREVEDCILPDADDDEFPDGYKQDPQAPDDATASRDCRRNFNEYARGFALHYRRGAFGKTLLSSVDRLDRDGKRFTSTTLDYFDEVSDGEDYDGFAPATRWEAHEDGEDNFLVDAFGSSAIGGAETNSGDGHVYVGFGAAAGKLASVGGSISIAGGATEALLELIDLNGDALPDKVFRERRGEVRYRLNESKPGGRTRFSDDSHLIGRLGNLSTDYSIGAEAAAEGYLGGSVQFSVGGEVAVSEDYFTDANADGLPDFVNGGKVLFNSLDEDGQPTFSSDSSLTRAPIGDLGDLSLTSNDEIEDAVAKTEQASRLHDTVRRWTAPWSGRVAIEGGAVTLESPPDLRPDAPPQYDGDGVRVAVQRGGDELWSANLPAPGTSATPDGVSNVHVDKGQSIYFRVGSVDHGVGDEVSWAPEIRYVHYDSELIDAVEDVGQDAEGRSQQRFTASRDFTLGGIPPQPVIAPLTGTLRFEGVLTKSRATTDELRVVVERNGVPVLERTIAPGEVHADGLQLGTTFDAEEPSDNARDRIDVRVEADTDVDLGAITWRPELWYLSAQKDGKQVKTFGPNAERLIDLPLVPHIDTYTTDSLDAPIPAGDGAPSTLILSTSITTTGAPPGTKGFLTVKQRDSLRRKIPFTIDSADADHVTAISNEDFDMRSDDPFWVDITFQDPRVRGTVVKTEVVIPQPFDDIPVPHRVWYPGPRDLFSTPYRGWGYAAYDGGGRPADAPLDEAAFRFDAGNVPSESPGGFGSVDLDRAAASPFYPTWIKRYAADGTVIGELPVLRGSKDNIFGAAARSSSSRRGADDPAAIRKAVTTLGAGASAPRLVGAAVPQFALNGGIGPLSGSVGGGHSFGFVDYVDMNGDGFPDIVTPGETRMTGPRGRRYDSGEGSLYRDTQVGVSVGFNGSPYKSTSDGKGQGAGGQAPAATSRGKRARRKVGGAARASSTFFGKSLGGSLGVEQSFTNPIDIGGQFSDALSGLPGEPPVLEQDLADVNGDGLPDKIEAGPDGVFVELNLGYRFAPRLRWSSGGFETGLGVTADAGVSLGFNSGKYEYAAGLSYNEGLDYSHTTWDDVNGDGILDQILKQGEDVNVKFGTGAGLQKGDPVDFGNWANGTADILNQDLFSTGEQVSEDHARSLGGGFDFTISIPVCPFAACWIAINPGVHYDHAVSRTTVALADVNGDGYPDSIASDNDDALKVRLNRIGRTNLLRTVRNPLGGTIELDYERQGNQPDRPTSQWVLSNVTTDDGTPGDGVDRRTTKYDYTGGRYDPLEREELGYEMVTERQLGEDGSTLRSWERRYRVGSVFESGLLNRETLLDASGNPARETRTTWQIVDQADDTPFDPSEQSGPAKLRVSAAARAVEVQQRTYDDSGAYKSWTSTFRYTDLGDIEQQVDLGEPGDPGDDLTATVGKLTCNNGTTNPNDDDPADPATIANNRPTCPQEPPPGTRKSPLWTGTRCPTWTSLPAAITVRDGAGKLLREREGAQDLCLNSSVTLLKERTQGTEQASTELAYDNWGSYNRIHYPRPDGALSDKTDRLGVTYVYDPQSHGKIASTTDTHGITTTASFDRRTGRVTERKDANGGVTSYDYDAAGRLSSVTFPADQGNGPTVTFSYVVAPGGSYAIAEHRDPANAGNPIRTVAFVDGSGRRVQTKQDWTVHRSVAQDAQEVSRVSGAIRYDALGRTISRSAPSTEPLASMLTRSTADVGPRTRYEYSTGDRLTKIIHPSGTSTTRELSIAPLDSGGPDLFRLRITDPEGKVTHSFTDVRGNLKAVDEQPSVSPRRRTRYDHDALGRVTKVTEPGEAVTTHGYDLLGRRISTSTPDGGLTEYRYDRAGRLVSKVTPNLRAKGQEIQYAYDLERLTKVDYPDAATPDVTYAYGAPQASDRRAGRVAQVRDGARTLDVKYDTMGNVSEEVWTPTPRGGNGLTTIPAQTTTSSFDVLGRPLEIGLPDGEMLRYGYDAGGRPNRISGTKGDSTTKYLDRLEYDEFGQRRYQLLGNGVGTAFSYDVMRRLDRQTALAADGYKIQDLAHTYDEVGNVLSVDNQLPPRLVAPRGGGPGKHTYAYDDYHRLTGATGVYQSAVDRRRDYTFGVTYDLAGNQATKQQVDVTTKVPGGGKQNEYLTSYQSAFNYSTSRPHQLAGVGQRSFTYDADGNMTGWTDKTKQGRAMTWDSADRMRTLTNAGNGSSTQYRYDESGALGFLAGGGEQFDFVNRFYTVQNGDRRLKSVWVGGDRIATKRETKDKTELFFLHKNHRGDVDTITTDGGAIAEHTEYFPSGEVWVREKDDGERPVRQQFAGGFLDQIRGITNLGQRWYEPRDGVWYAPDPLLTDTPGAAVDDPAVLPAYSYAQSNPLRLVDTGGRDTVSYEQASLPRILGATIADHASRMFLPAAEGEDSRFLGFADKLDGKAFIEVKYEGGKLTSIGVFPGLIGFLGYSKTFGEADDGMNDLAAGPDAAPGAAAPAAAAGAAAAPAAADPPAAQRAPDGAAASDAALPGAPGPPAAAGGRGRAQSLGGASVGAPVHRRRANTLP